MTAATGIPDTPRLILRRLFAGVTFAQAAWVGLPAGLATARLLYEIHPLRNALFGQIGPALVLAAVGSLLAWAVLALIDWRIPARGLPSAALLPAALIWLYLLTPPMEVNPLRGGVLLGGAFALIVALAVPWLVRPDVPVPALLRRIGMIAAGSVALLAYLLTLQRAVGRADTFEFQVTAPVLGVAHPTGYPLYILLGKLFSLLPLGKVATRVNLTSVAAATLAVIALYLALRRVFQLDRTVAALAALSFALSPIFWSQAVIAEVYALHNAFAASIIGLALWLVLTPGADESESPVPGTESAGPRRARRVILLFALIGLSLTNHLTTVLLIPAVVAALLLAWPRLSPKQCLIAVGVLAAALLIYLYIPLRWPALNEGRLMRFDEFWGWVTGSRFSGALQLRAWLVDAERWRIVARLALAQYGWPGATFGVVGFALMVWRHWRAALVTGLVGAAQVFYGLNYLVPDIGVFLIPLFLVQAIWMGYGVATLVDWFSRRFPLGHEVWAHAALVTVVALLPLRAAWTTGPTFDWSEEGALETWGRRVLALPLVEASAILADSEKIAPLEYLHRIEGLRPDVTMVVLGTEQEYQADLQARLAEGQTVYLARFLPGLEGAYHLRSLGPLVEVGTAPLTEPPVLRNGPVAWENGITLLGVEVADPQVRVGDEAWITLYWQAQAALEDNYQVRVRLVDAGGTVVWEDAPAYPASNRYPPVAWKDAEIVSDFHAIRLPHSLRPGRYTVQVSLGPPFSRELARIVTGGMWADAALLEVLPASREVPIGGQRMAVAFADGALVGVDAAPSAPRGGAAEFVATWRNRTAEQQTEYSVPMDGETASFPILAQNAPLRLEAIPSTSPDAIQWQLAGIPLRCGWLMQPTGSCQLATTRVAGAAAAQAVANFDNKMLLGEVVFEAGRLAPGQAVEVTLSWQGLSEMGDDYTIFVHLLGPDGRVHGQIDQWPVQGTYPTSTWPVGERIEDRYLVPLDSGAPPGSYQLEIGVYLLATNTRLPVLDAEGIAVDDRVLLGGLLLPE